MPRVLLSSSIPFAIALLVAQSSAASPSAPVAAANVSTRIVPIDQVVSLADPGVALIRPTDGRLRGYGFSAVITGVAAADSAGPGAAPISAGPHRHLVVFSLNLTKYSATSGLGDGTTTPALSADVALDGGYLPISTHKLSSDGQGTYSVSVPNGHGDVDLQLTAADLTSSFSLTTLHRVGTQPAVLYRDPAQPSLSVRVDQSVVVPVEVPDEQFAGEEILGVKSATLTEFEPGDPSVQPSDPNEAYLAIAGTDAADPDPQSGSIDIPGEHFVDGFSALAPSALTLTLPGGQTAAAAQSGSTGDGLLSGMYYLAVPAGLTSATLSVAPGTVAGVVYPDSTGVNDNITFPQPAVFTLTLPPPPTAPVISTSTSTLPVIHKNPTTALVKVSPGTGEVGWLIPVAAAVLIGVGTGLLRGRRRNRRSGAGRRPHPYRPLVPLGEWRRIDAASFPGGTAVPALGPGPQPPRAHGSNSVSETSPPSSLSTSEDLPTSHVGRPQGPAVFIVLSHEFPVNQGSLRDSAPLRVLARPEADP